MRNRSRSDERRRARLCAAVVLAGAILASHAHAVDLTSDLTQFTIVELLAQFERDGVEVLYSSDLVKPWMRVREQPEGATPQSILESVLAPYDLAVRAAPEGALMIVRAAPEAQASTPRVGEPAPAPDPAPASRTGMLPLEELVVQASQYRLARDVTSTVTTLAAADLELLPDLGDDPLRAVARLPGMASSDFSARINIRGGETGETLVLFDGMRLYDPFHLKEFQSLFSAIDPRVVRDINVLAGGFPAQFGDRMSGVIDIASLVPPDETRREISLSFFNASALAAGRFKDGEADRGDWKIAGRRSMLDLALEIADPDLGRPTYTELYGHLRRALTPDLDLSGNLLLLDDDILLFDSDQEEEARSTYRDAYYWLELDHRASAALSARHRLSYSRLEADRSGTSELPGISAGSLSESRSATITALETDWRWQLSDALLIRAGADWRHMRARYDYRDDVDFEVLILSPGAQTETERHRSLSARPTGDQYGAYATLRYELLDDLFVEAGLRWDHETLSGRDGSLYSPRVSVAYILGERTTLRASTGRFYQSQGINELPIADGVTGFYAPQRSDHFIAGIEHTTLHGLALRLEAYRKRYDRLRPRFENLLNTRVLLPELKPDRVMIAPDDAVATGVEASLRYESGRAWSGWLTYAWSSIEDHTRGTDLRRSWDQTHQISAGANLRRGNWVTTLAARYHSGWPTTALTLVATEPIPLAAAGPRNGERLGSYVSLDVRIARTFEFESAGVLTVFLEATNLTNRANDCCVEYEIEDEEDGLLLDVAAVESTPLIPSLGFVWQF
jgi:outer membrane receptor protein involved in Fe transport